MAQLHTNNRFRNTNIYPLTYNDNQTFRILNEIRKGVQGAWRNTTEGSHLNAYN